MAAFLLVIMSDSGYGIPYVTCKNVWCSGLKNGGYCWRPIDKGPNNCPKCQTPFRISKSQRSWSKSGEGNGERGRDDKGQRQHGSSNPGNGKGKGTGKASSDGWHYQNSKGRSKPMSSTSGAANGSDDSEQTEDSAFEALLRKKLESRPHFSHVADELLQDFFP